MDSIMIKFYGTLGLNPLPRNYEFCYVIVMKFNYAIFIKNIATLANIQNWKFMEYDAIRISVQIHHN